MISMALGKGSVLSYNCTIERTLLIKHQQYFEGFKAPAQGEDGEKKDDHSRAEQQPKQPPNNDRQGNSTKPITSKKDPRGNPR